MNLDEIRALFLTAFQNRKVIKPRLESSMLKMRGYRHCIYSYAALPALQQILKTVPETHFSLGHQTNEVFKYSVRYVIDPSGTIWFAQEGAKGNSTPTHSQINEHCIAAGNVIFSNNYERIIKINNKSGHFEPGIETLVWTIAALLSLNAPLAQEIELEFQRGVNVENETIILSPDELRSLIPEEALVDAHSDYLIKVKYRDKTTFITTPNGQEQDDFVQPTATPDDGSFESIAKRPRLNSTPSVRFYPNHSVFAPGAATVAVNSYTTPPPGVW